MTHEQMNYMRENAGKLSAREIADNLGLKKYQVKNFFAFHKIKYSSAATDTRFKANQTPWNKGTKGVMKANSGSFKTGQKPANTLKIGDIVTKVDRCGKIYKFIKYKDGLRAFKLLHRHIWEQAHGEIPKNMIVTFIDGDSLNCAIENLKLITKAENAVRNSFWNGIGKATDKFVINNITRDKELQNKIAKIPQLLKLKQQELELKKQIKRITN